MHLHSLGWCSFSFFFFSSRRRHTRSLCDWSSDVCSSDLQRGRPRTRSSSSRDKPRPSGPFPHSARALLHRDIQSFACSLFFRVALPHRLALLQKRSKPFLKIGCATNAGVFQDGLASRSEEHTSELQSHSDLVCRLLLEKKKKKIQHTTN